MLIVLYVVEEVDPLQGNRLAFSRRKVIVALAGTGILYGAWHVWEKRSPGRLSDSWWKDPPETLSSLDMEQTSKELVLNVQSAQVTQACHALEHTSFVALTELEVQEYCGKALTANRSNRKPYLMRCICTDIPTRQCSVLQKGTAVWVGCGMLSHYRVDVVDHWPIVVYLAVPPSNVYVTFSVAE